MRITRTSDSGAVQARTLAILVVLAAVVGLLIVLLNRPASESPRVVIPAGPLELSRTNLVLEEGRLRRMGAATPFTGIMLEHYPDGTLRSRSAISNGVLHGLSEGWYTNAQRQVSETFKEGVSHLLRTKWYPDGVKQSEANIADGKLHGSFRKWHENAALSEQVEFVDGQPEGVSSSHFPSGYLKARVVMKDGKPIEQTHWKDGEKKE